MIVLEPAAWEWDDQIPSGHIESVTVFTPSHERVSELLGPDGEPLMVPYPRPSLGFDLRPKCKGEQKDTNKSEAGT